jgi:hypothetical protein
MRLRNAGRFRTLNLLLAATALAVAPKAARCQSDQAPSSATEDTKLNTRVSLALDSVTLADIAASISKQAGMTLIPSAAVRDRRVTARVTGISVRGVLDTICETYDWRWYRQSQDSYVLDRRIIRRPQDLSRIPELMQTALPVDFRMFASLPNLKTKKPDERTGQTAAQRSVQTKFRGMNGLRSSLTGVFNSRDSFGVQEMSPRQREDLLTWLVFTNLDRSMELLHNDAGPHQIRPTQITISLGNKNTGLMLNTTPDVNPGFGFGTQVFFPDGRPVP